jgi:hypothetical protein
MHWNINITITDVEETQYNDLRLKLYSHHSITKAEQPQEFHQNTIDEEPKEERYPKKIECIATVFSDDERKGLEIYIDRLKQQEFINIKYDFIDLDIKNKFKKVARESSVAAAIVFIIIFSHEYIVTLAHDGNVNLKNLFVILGFSFAGALATFWIDSLIIYKDKFGGIGWKKVSN